MNLRAKDYFWGAKQNFKLYSLQSEFSCSNLRFWCENESQRKIADFRTLWNVGLLPSCCYIYANWNWISVSWNRAYPIGYAAEAGESHWQQQKSCCKIWKPKSLPSFLAQCLTKICKPPKNQRSSNNSKMCILNNL